MNISIFHLSGPNTPPPSAGIQNTSPPYDGMSVTAGELSVPKYVAGI